MPRERPYAYPVTNSELIRIHNLAVHPEGGYFCQTTAVASYVPDSPQWPDDLPKSDLVHGKGREQIGWGPAAQVTGGSTDDPNPKGKDHELDATAIYYLLTGDNPKGTLHMNAHPHFHCLHAGRSRYTLIHPSADAPVIQTITMGPMGPIVDEGEVTQVFGPRGCLEVQRDPR
ncbi:hypothetical protein BD324DRAFT_612606 [Kockovaella imperatae]|uniref:DUF985 domain-containing protein n=1 Tax=Kockovaella imperatae TaxID=4999 RepID=A0A1Y1UU40_9TREE|nr:hypothetical protein BD324DRAFT_612606 [Kockovaella imperatae]ORX40936.1 hypothetical protein BD324DRAFT_612606 [Kockovaella imperatae]